MYRPPLDTEQLQRSLVEVPQLSFFTEIDVVESTGSTNADLMTRAAAHPDLERVALVAETQRQGRGRHTRAWTSPPRAQIAVSILARPAGIAPATLGWLPLLTGVAVVDAVRKTAGLPATLKWPNDVLIDGRKVAGILAEVVSDPVPAVVVGTGLNVSLAADELPVPHATSLTLAGSPVSDRTELVQSLLAEFAHRFTAWQQADWATTEIAAAYRQRCSTLGSHVRAELPGGRTLTGVARDIDDAGQLLIGSEAVSAGEVTHLRPANE